MPTGFAGNEYDVVFIVWLERKFVLPLLYFEQMLRLSIKNYA